MEGDMAGCIVPTEDVKKILENPLGFEVITENQPYSNPNRFFSHWILKEYYNTFPFIVQKFANPIESIYLSSAIVKTVIQIILILLLAFAITGSFKVLKLDFMIAVSLIYPLFQTNGYRPFIGIIDPSVTYTFFYAVPCIFLILYFLPFIFQLYHSKIQITPTLILIFWIPLAFVVSLSGPLNPGVALVFSLLAFFIVFKKYYNQTNQKSFISNGFNSFIKIPINYWFFLLPISLLSFYSLYIGSFNSYSIVSQIPLSEMYSRLPEGIFNLFTHKIAFPILFIILTLNTVLIHRYYKTTEGKKMISTFKWIGIFALIYVLLLPLGGYREYRPLIVRYDTFMPVTLSLIFIFGATTLFLFKNMSNKQRMWYIPLIVGILIIYTNADEAQFNNNRCERMALKEISESKDSIVPIQNNCTVLSWGNITNPKDSELNAELLKIWKITNEKKHYYNK